MYIIYSYLDYIDDHYLIELPSHNDAKGVTIFRVASVAV